MNDETKEPTPEPAPQPQSNRPPHLRLAHHDLLEQLMRLRLRRGKGQLKYAKKMSIPVAQVEQLLNEYAAMVNSFRGVSAQAQQMRGALQGLADETAAQTREECAVIAMNATLPEDFQWGHDAMEQFDFGKERAAEAIRAAGNKPTKPSVDQP